MRVTQTGAFIAGRTDNHNKGGTMNPLALVAAIIILAAIIYAVLYGCLRLARRSDDQDDRP